MSSTSKRPGTKRPKASPSSDPDTWECTVCTYRNRYEAFKCDMCDTRKGTSTRKPRLNQNTIEQQQLMQNIVIQQQKTELNAAEGTKRRSLRSQSSPTPTPPSSSRGPTSPADSLGTDEVESKTPSPPLSHSHSNPGSNNCTPKTRSQLMQQLRHLKGVDTNSARTLAVTVNGITVVVTDYKLKPPVIAQDKNSPQSSQS